MEAAVAREVCVLARHWLLPQEPNTQLPLVVVARVAEVIPVETDQILCSAPSPAQAAVAAVEPDKMAGLVVAVVFTIPPVGLETLRPLVHLKEIMAVQIAAPVMELAAVVVAHRRLDRRRAVVVKMPEMAGTAQPQAFLVRR